MSTIVIPLGTMAFIYNRLIPNGGVKNAISIFMMNKMPNHVGSKLKALIMGKNIGNWLHSKNLNGVTASLLGYFIGRILLTSHHWFSYGGLREPTLYLSALFMFSIFTLMGILTGVIAKGLNDDLSDWRVVPILLPVMVAAHFAFDFVMSQLMVISKVIIPLLPLA